MFLFQTDVETIAFVVPPTRLLLRRQTPHIDGEDARARASILRIYASIADAPPTVA